MAGQKLTFGTQVTDVDATARDDIGCLRYNENAVFKYVRFSGTTAINIGDFLCYVATDATDTTVDGANTAHGAGVAQAAVPIGPVAYGWIQIRGIATLSTALAGAPAVGDVLTSSGAAAPAVTKITAVNMQPVGFTVNVANKTVSLSCPN